jgi:hypothetical protein
MGQDDGVITSLLSSVSSANGEALQGDLALPL